jgi:hypothetical protein
MRIFELPFLEDIGSAIIFESTYEEAFKKFPKVIIAKKPSCRIIEINNTIRAQNVTTNGTLIVPTSQYDYQPHNAAKHKSIECIAMHIWNEQLAELYIMSGKFIIVFSESEFDKIKSKTIEICQKIVRKKSNEEFKEKIEKIKGQTSSKIFLEEMERNGFDAEKGTTRGYAKIDDIEFGERKGVTGNGDTLTRTNSIWRNHLIIKHKYESGYERLDIPGIGVFFRDEKGNPTFKTPGRKKEAIQLCGLEWAGVLKRGVPKIVKDTLLSDSPSKHKKVPRCAVTGTTESLEIDHIEGRAGISGFSTSDSVENYQILSRHANQTKRNRCGLCKIHNLRCNAETELGMPIAFTEGSDDFDRKIGCKGCILSNRKKFLVEMAEMLMTGDKAYTEKRAPLIDQYTEAERIPWPGETGWTEWLDEKIQQSWM